MKRGCSELDRQRGWRKKPTSSWPRGWPQKRQVRLGALVCHASCNTVASLQVQMCTTSDPSILIRKDKLCSLLLMHAQHTMHPGSRRRPSQVSKCTLNVVVPSGLSIVQSKDPHTFSASYTCSRSYTSLAILLAYWHNVRQGLRGVGLRSQHTQHRFSSATRLCLDEWRDAHSADARAGCTSL